MCLSIDYKVTNALKKRKTGFIWAFKLVLVKNKKLCPPYVPETKLRYKPGWNKAKGKLDIDMVMSELHGGAIHCFRRKITAIMRCPEIYDSSDYFFVIKVKCFMKDFVAADKHSIAFKKVFLNRSDYLEAFKKSIIRERK